MACMRTLSYGMHVKSTEISVLCSQLPTALYDPLEYVSLYWRRNDERGSVFSFTCMLSAKMYVHFKNKIDCAQ